MSATPDNSPSYTARDHLLGRLSEALQDAADERSVSDPQYYEELLSDEELLIEEYADGQLSAEDAAAFEALCRVRPDVRDRLACQRALPNILRTSTPRAPVQPRPRVLVMERRRLSVALAASVAILLGGTSLYLNYQLSEQRRIAANREREWQQRDVKQRETIAQLEKQGQTAAPSQQAPTKAPTIQPGNSQEPGPVLASLIIPAFSRGDATILRFTIPAGTGQVELHFNIGSDTDFPSYRVAVEAAGSVIKRATAKPHRVDRYNTVSIRLPVRFKSEQRLQASVSGVRPGQPDELVAGYSFILVHVVQR